MKQQKLPSLESHPGLHPSVTSKKTSGLETASL
jgi:hypothetical protein